MKKSVILLIILNIMAALALPMVCSYENENVYENNDMFLRLHVRAESDSEEDQELKLKVRDTVLKETTALLSDCKDKNEAISIISENFDLLKTEAEKTVKDNGFDYPVSVEIKKEHFEYREYDGFFLPEDTYDSLIINIGSGNGHNWWCVVFPAVCLSGSSASEENEISAKEEPVQNSESEISDENNTDDGSVSASVEVDLSAVPDEYHLAKDPVPEKVVYDFWIVRFFKNLFGIK